MPAHTHPFYQAFNRSHTDLYLAIGRGLKWAEYLPLLKRANNDSRLFSLMRRSWGDPLC